MPLLDAIYKYNLKEAFKKESWEEFAIEFATITDEYIGSGTVETNITATVTPPPPASPYVVADTGEGFLITDMTSSGSGEDTSGYQELSSSPLVFVGDVAPGLVTDSYDIKIKIDNGALETIMVEVSNTDTWTEIIESIQSELQTITENQDSVTINLGKIKIQSHSTGTDSKVYIEDGTTNPLLAAINLLPDMTISIEDAVDGTIGSGEKHQFVKDIIDAFDSDDWNEVCDNLATAIDTYVKSSTITMLIAPPGSSTLIGTGSGNINPTGKNLLATNLKTSFNTETIWDTVAENIQSNIKDYITEENIVTTIDIGVIPINSWTGTGIGKVT